MRASTFGSNWGSLNPGLPKLYWSNCTQFGVFTEVFKVEASVLAGKTRGSSVQYRVKRQRRNILVAVTCVWPFRAWCCCVRSTVKLFAAHLAFRYRTKVNQEMLSFPKNMRQVILKLQCSKNFFRWALLWAVKLCFYFIHLLFIFLCLLFPYQARCPVL